MKPPKRIDAVLDCTDYDKFEHLSGYNRKVESSNLKDKKASLESFKFIGDIIIILTSAFGKAKQLIIADGQHRLEVCKLLGIPFDYKVYAFSKGDDTKLNVIKFIAEYNSSAVNWTPEKFLNAFAADEIPEYVTMKNALKETKLTITDLQNIYLFGCGAKEVKEFKSGVMNFPDIKKSLELQKAIVELRDILPNKSYVRRSLFKVFKEVDTDIQTIVKRIKSDVSYVQRRGLELPENEKKMYEFLKAIFELETA